MSRNASSWIVSLVTVMALGACAGTQDGTANVAAGNVDAGEVVDAGMVGTGGSSGTPLILDVGGNGQVDLTPVEQVFFDVDSDGTAERTAWTRMQGPATDAFLAMDRNGNGVIDSGLELFGNQHGAAHGFEELAKLDATGDGRIDPRDSAYMKLQAWQDLDGNGVSGPGELKTLRDMGVTSLMLTAESSDARDAHGNGLFQQGWCTWASRLRRGVVVDAWLQRGEDAVAAGL